MGLQTDANTAFIGSHNIEGIGCFDVFYTSTGYFWWNILGEGKVGQQHGPFATAEGAYLSACHE